MNKFLQFIKELMGGIGIRWTDFNRRLLTTIYRDNPYVFAIIERLASYHANIRYMAVRDLPDGSIEEVDTGLGELLENPSSIMGKKEFYDAVIRYYYTYGEAVIYGQQFEGGNSRGMIDKDGLMLINPELLTIQTDGPRPTGYIVGNRRPALPAENICHVKAFNPQWDDPHGHPFIRSALRIIDKLNAADEIEVKNFQNGGPAWVASAKNPDSFSSEEYNSFIDRLKALWKSPKNKGGVVGTSAQIDLQHVGKSPVDMGVQASIDASVKTLAMVFGLDAGTFDTTSSTYNNKLLIDKAIYTSVIIPFAEKFASKMTAWLGEKYGGVRVEVDTTGIEALQSNKGEMINWMTTANVFTDNEIREAVSYDRVDAPEADLTPAERRSQYALTGFDDLDREVVE
jgi:HK97 family phage portal protein